MNRFTLVLAALALPLAACGPGLYTRAEVVYAEPPQYTYVVPVERVVIVARDVLENRGYVVYRVDQEGPDRVIWARRGDDEVVRVFATPQGERVLVRGLTDVRDRGRHNEWVRRGRAEEVVGEVDGRLRREAH